jgi:hypothetical protein
VDLGWKPDDSNDEVLWHRVRLEVAGVAVGAALVAGGADSHAPSHHLVDRVARELFQAGDAAASGSA